MRWRLQLAGPGPRLLVIRRTRGEARHDLALQTVKGKRVPTYVFHSFQRGGAALSFEVCDLSCDAEAIPHARIVLVDHPSAAEVEVWDDQRLVHRLTRRRGRPRLRFVEAG